LTLVSKLEGALDSRIGKAIAEYNMIEPNDRIMVATSGGKDSWALLFTLRRLSEKAPVSFKIAAVHVDANFPGQSTEPIEEYLKQHGFEYEVLRTGIYELLKMKLDPRDNPCSFCSRMRRGAIYGRAKKGDFTKIALGHHKEDLMETFLMNLFFVGQLRAMAPKYVTDDGAHVVIRPMIFVGERLISRYAEVMKFPITDDCPYKGDKASKRDEMKMFIRELERKNPKVKKSIMKAMSNVDTVHLLDKKLRQEGL
jgi:tRNA 2-thiocytidine biosynthesis protein TtcA